MNKRIILMLFALSIVISMVACQKKEEQPVPKAPMSPMAQPSDLNQPVQPQGQQMMPPHGQDGLAPHGQEGMAPHGSMGAPKKVEVPADVKKSWSKVKLVFTDKATKKTQEFTVALGSEFAIPGTDLKVAVGDFLPDFKIIGSTITSGSNEPVNPGVHVEVFEKGKSIFKGWLYSKFPDMHPFEHEKYGLNLKEGIRK